MNKLIFLAALLIVGGLVWFGARSRDGHKDGLQPDSPGG